MVKKLIESMLEGTHDVYLSMQLNSEINAFKGRHKLKYFVIIRLHIHIYEKSSVNNLLKMIIEGPISLITYLYSFYLIGNIQLIRR